MYVSEREILFLCRSLQSHTEELLVITSDPTSFKVPNYYFIEIVFGMCTTPVLVWENFEETPSGRCCNFLIHNSYLIFLQHELPVGQIKIVDKEYNKGPNKQANSFPVLSVLWFQGVGVQHFIEWNVKDVWDSAFYYTTVKCYFS